MADDLEPLKEPKVAEAVAQLESLLSQSQRAFLIGAGCSLCAGLPPTNRLTDLVLGALGDEPAAKILSDIKARYSKSEQANIEDYMSEIVDLLSLAERRSVRGIENQTVDYAGQTYKAEDLRAILTKIKAKIAHEVTNEDRELSTHRAFVRAVHRTLQSGKNEASRRVDYFVLNYDTVLEDALGLERLHHHDGIRGGMTGWWDASVFDDNETPIRVFKLHGSVDWCLIANEVLPRRIRPSIGDASSVEHVMIWPAATKYRETQLDPYAQMLDRFRTALRPPLRSEIVLTICGYSFGDSHINSEIEKGLRESGEQLTIVAFTCDDAPGGQLKDWLDDSSIRRQVRVYANKGFFHGDEAHHTEHELPWWKFEVLTRLLGGER